MLDKLNSYAMALLTATVAVSTIIRLVGLEDKPWAKRVLSVCFDLGGALRGYTDARGPK